MSGLIFIFIIMLMIFALSLAMLARQKRIEIDRITGTLEERKELLKMIEQELQERGIAA